MSNNDDEEAPDGIMMSTMSIRDDVTEATVSAELDEAGASLPNVEELRTSLGGRPSSRSRSSWRGRNNNSNTSSDNTKVSLKWVWIGAALSFLLLVIVLPVVSVKQNQRNNNNNSNSNNSNSNLSRGPDAGAPTRPRPSFDDVKQFVLQNAISSAADLETEGSPQQRAARWLAEDDPANLIVPSEDIDTVAGYRYMARYILALDYYHWQGDTAWYDTLNFLSGDDICFWNKQFLTPNGALKLGVFCNWLEQWPLPRFLHFSAYTNSITVCSTVLLYGWLCSCLYCCKTIAVFAHTDCSCCCCS